MFGIFCDLCGRQIETDETRWQFKLAGGVLVYVPNEDINPSAPIHLCEACVGVVTFSSGKNP